VSGVAEGECYPIRLITSVGSSGWPHGRQ
jgi:hypothetical protein